MKIRILILSILVPTIIYSQNDNLEKLSRYKELKITSLDSYKKAWSQKQTIKKGLIVENEFYFKNKLRSRQKYVYDSLNNLKYEIMIFTSDQGEVNDTLKNIILIYDDQDNLIQRKFSGIVENLSNFDQNKKPQLITRFSENEEIMFRPFEENLKYDNHGNLIGEVIKRNQIDQNSELQVEIETNNYKYDNFGNIIEIKRSFKPERNFPIYMSGGKSLYKLEKFRYSYNRDGLWEKKILILDDKNILLKKRSFTK